MDPSESPRGRVVRGLPFSLRRHDPVSIGSDRGSDVEIEGADPHHADLRWDADEECWFLHDDPAPGKTLLNNDPIVCGRLYEGDVVEVAGVRLRFSEQAVSALNPEGVGGIRVAVRDLTACVKDSDGDGGWKTLLKDVSFQVAEGSFTAILGPSGCGKSTLIQRLAGFPLDGKMEGDVLLNENPLSVGDSSLLRHVAYLPQAVDETLYDNLSVRETVESFAHSHLPAGSRPNYSAALDSVQLKWSELASKPVRKLSGGQKRRLALALELLREPKLLLLDEPTAGLDPAAESGIMVLLRRLSGPGKKTILCATHVLGSLNQCRNVLVMAPGGRIAFHGKPRDALARFGTEAWLDVYQKLATGNWSSESANETEIAGSPALPPIPRPAPFRGAFLATLGRLFRSILSKWNPLLFAVIPIVVSILLLFACRSLLDDREYGTVYFCMTVAMFWFGLSGTFRNLVSERVPKRCLDRLRGMPLGRYFAAHAVFAFVSSFVQSLLFVLPIFAWRLGQAPEFTFHAFPAFWFDLGLVGFSGGCIGLVVSALAKKELYAAWALPLVAIPTLFLSKPVLGYDYGKKPEQPLRAIECLMPTLYPQTLLESSMKRAKVYFVLPDPKELKNIRGADGRQTSVADAQRMSVDDWTKRRERRNEKTGSIVRDEKTGEPVLEKSWSDKHVLDALRFFALVVGYAILGLFTAFRVQNWRERQWDGR